MEKPANHATESESPHHHNKSDDHEHSNETSTETVTETETPKSESPPQPSLDEVMEAVDDFIESLSSATDPLREIPPSVEPFPETVDSLVSKMESSGLGRDETEDSVFIEAVNRISKSVIRLRELKLDSTPVSSWLNRASSVQHRAVSLLDEEFRHLLDPSKEKKRNHHNNGDGNNDHHHKSNSTEENESAEKEEEEEEESFPNFSSETISTLRKIAGAMINAGYESECCMSYEISRRHAFKEELREFGFEGINVEDVQRIAWESLEGEIANWISIVRRCSTLLFPGEVSLCNSIFSDENHSQIRKRLLAGLVSAVTIRFLDFSGAVVLTRRSSEKLFKFLDMYETLRDLIPAVEKTDPDLINEIKLAQTRLGEAAVTIFAELENSIKSDSGRTPVPSGAVHPLTRYTMNYLKYACEYKESLDQVFTHYEKAQSDDQTESKPEPETKRNQREEDDEYKTSAFARQMIRVMELLDANLEIKSRLYRDQSLRSIFLMNNGRYILQKIKGSVEIRDLMGQSWTRKRSTELRQYHKSYQRETWGKVLQCLNQEGIQVNGKVSKPVLKERFKIFNTMFDEIHKTQSSWIVSDEQMQSELRVSIAALVIPAYRSFFGRYKTHLDSGKSDKYVKYQPEDIESFIDDLFDGNHPSTVARRRT